MISLIKKMGINPQDKSTRYCPQWTRVSTVNETQLAKRMAEGQQDADDEGGDTPTPTPTPDPSGGGDTGDTGNTGGGDDGPGEMDQN